MKRALFAAISGLWFSAVVTAQDPSPQEAKPAAQPASQPAAESPVPANESFVTGSVDFGYRWLTGVGGSLNTYRSIIDLGSGPKLFGTEFTIIDPKHFYFDRADVRGYNWGDDPYSTVHVDAMKTKVYDFSADYRNIAYYNNLPGYADPLFGSGVVLNEQSLDTHQRFTSFRLDLLPQHWLVPYLAYDRDSGRGDGIATFVSDADEFPVFTKIRNLTNNYRGGIRIELPRFHVTLEQGGTTFKDDQQLTQTAGTTNFGNFLVPVIGQRLALTSLSQLYGVRGDSIYTKGLLTASPASWIDFYGQFLYSQPTSNVSFSQLDAGNEVLFSQLLFYTGEQRIVSGISKLPHTSGSIGAEIRPFRRLRVLPSWLTDRMHTTGSDTSQQRLTTAAGSVPINALLSSSLVTNYNQTEINLMYDLTSKITLRGGYRYIWGNAADVILPLSGLAGLDQGKIRRNVALAGFAFRPIQKLSINADFEDGSSGSAYFRTSLYNYQKGHVRGRYQVLPSLNISANATVLNNENPAIQPIAGFRSDFLSWQESLSFLYSPAGGRLWALEGGYSRSMLRSDLGYLDPAFLTPQRSSYRDNSNTVTALLDANLPVAPGRKAKLSFGGSLFLSTGNNPTKFYQPVGKLSVPINKTVAWITEWRYYGFEEAFYLYQSFRAQTVMTGLRLSR